MVKLRGGHYLRERIQSAKVSRVEIAVEVGQWQRAAEEDSIATEDRRRLMTEDAEG